MRSFVLRICVAAGLLFLPSNSDSIPKGVPSRQTIWFIVSQSDKGKLYLEPLAKNSDGHLVPVPNGCDPDEPTYRRFVGENFASGQSYSMSFRGRFVGSAVFNENREEQGSLLVASSDKRNLIPFDLNGLASTEPISTSRLYGRRTATPAEETSAKEIALRSFKTAGIPAAALTKLTVDKLERAYLLPSRTPSLIGSLSIDMSEQEGLVHSLFLIATKRGTKYRVDLLWSKVSRGETDNEKMQLIDYADLFGDGNDKVVVGLQLYENYFYRIYERKRNSSQWEQIFEAQAPTCE